VIPVIGFTVGGMLIGRSLWQYLYENIGLLCTAVTGLVIFIGSGIYMHQFYDLPEEHTHDKAC